MLGNLGALGIGDRTAEGALGVRADEFSDDVDLLADPAIDIVARTEPNGDVAVDALLIVGTQWKQRFDGAEIIDIDDAIDVIESFPFRDPTNEGFARWSVS